MGQETGHQVLRLENQKKLTVTGVSEILKFEETEAILQTPTGPLVIQGEQLQLKGLSLEGGQAVVEGSIQTLSYHAPMQSTWLGRLFG